MLRTALRQSTRLYSTSLAPSAKKVAPSIAQSANRPSTWSKSQRPKEDAMVGPRFEQMTLSAQPNPMAAIELIAEEPVHKANKRVVACDGGGGPLGHPKVYINLDQPGAHACGYCGIRYEMEHHHH